MAIYRPQYDKILLLGCGPRVHGEVVLYAAVPGFIVTGEQIHPFLVAHLVAPL